MQSSDGACGSLMDSDYKSTLEAFKNDLESLKGILALGAESQRTCNEVLPGGDCRFRSGLNPDLKGVKYTVNELGSNATAHDGASCLIEHQREGLHSIEKALLGKSDSSIPLIDEMRARIEKLENKYEFMRLNVNGENDKTRQDIKAVKGKDSARAEPVTKIRLGDSKVAKSKGSVKAGPVTKTRLGDSKVAKGKGSVKTERVPKRKEGTDMKGKGKNDVKTGLRDSKATKGKDIEKKERVPKRKEGTEMEGKDDEKIELENFEAAEEQESEKIEQAAIKRNLSDLASDICGEIRLKRKQLGKASIGTLSEKAIVSTEIEPRPRQFRSGSDELANHIANFCMNSAIYEENLSNLSADMQTQLQSADFDNRLAEKSKMKPNFKKALLELQKKAKVSVSTKSVSQGIQNGKREEKQSRGFSKEEQNIEAEIAEIREEMEKERKEKLAAYERLGKDEQRIESLMNEMNLTIGTLQRSKEAMKLDKEKLEQLAVHTDAMSKKIVDLEEELEAKEKEKERAVKIWAELSKTCDSLVQKRYIRNEDRNSLAKILKSAREGFGNLRKDVLMETKAVQSTVGLQGKSRQSLRQDNLKKIEAENVTKKGKVEKEEAGNERKSSTTRKMEGNENKAEVNMVKGEQEDITKRPGDNDEHGNDDIFDDHYDDLDYMEISCHHFDDKDYMATTGKEEQDVSISKFIVNNSVKHSLRIVQLENRIKLMEGRLHKWKNGSQVKEIVQSNVIFHQDNKVLKENLGKIATTTNEILKKNCKEIMDVILNQKTRNGEERMKVFKEKLISSVNKCLNANWANINQACLGLGSVNYDAFDDQKKKQLSGLLAGDRSVQVDGKENAGKRTNQLKERKQDGMKKDKTAESNDVIKVKTNRIKRQTGNNGDSKNRDVKLELGLTETLRIAAKYISDGAIARALMQVGVDNNDLLNYHLDGKENNRLNNCAISNVAANTKGAVVLKARNSDKCDIKNGDKGVLNVISQCDPLIMHELESLKHLFFLFKTARMVGNLLDKNHSMNDGGEILLHGSKQLSRSMLSLASFRGDYEKGMGEIIDPSSTEEDHAFAQMVNRFISALFCTIIFVPPAKGSLHLRRSVQMYIRHHAR